MKFFGKIEVRNSLADLPAHKVFVAMDFPLPFSNPRYLNLGTASSSSSSVLKAKVEVKTNAGVCRERIDLIERCAWVHRLIPVLVRQIRTEEFQRDVG